MTITVREQKLLSAFPRPPPGLPTPANSPLPSPDPVYHAATFGFIPVGLSRASDSDSLYDEPQEQVIANAHALIPAPSASMSITSKNSAELQLVLDNPSRVYSPSETITGYVLGWDSASTNLQIILEGRAKTYIRTDKLQYKDRAPLLYQTFHLRPEAPGAIPRFSITIPERTAGGLRWLDKISPKDALYGNYWTHEWPEQAPYEYQAERPLPPSITMPLRRSVELLSNVSGWGNISYKLIAVRSQLETTTSRLEPNASCQVPIRLTTRRLPQVKVQALLKDSNILNSDLHIQTAQLSKDRRLSLREQLRDAFNSAAPVFYFKTSMSTPKLSTPGADAKVTITVSILPPPAGRLYNFPIPDISITSLRFRVKAYTGLRVMRNIPNEQEPARTHTFKHYEVQTSQSPEKATFKPRNGAFDGQSCVSTVSIPRSILPSFKTYNLWRSYRLECEATFSVAGKNVSTKTKSDLNIVAQPAGTIENATGSNTTQGEDDAVVVEMAMAMVRTFS